MIIRNVRKDDLPKLIWKELENWEEAIYKEYETLQTTDDFWLVAEIDGEPIGQIYASITGKNGNPYLKAFRVKPEHRRKGIGSALLKKAEEELKNRGAKGITIAVDVGNEAQELYERNGYIVVSTPRVEHWKITHNGAVHEEDITLIDLEKNLL